jgi:DNA-binding winged helix-turn-helix (wHTH) protein/tetratricopeptide (TPR) repeat protein
VTGARFAEFEFDLHSHELLRSGFPVRLQRQPAAILATLLGASGKVVTRDQLREALWNPSVHLDFDHSLDKSISKLRAHLGDSRTRPRFIETLSRRGYRFIAPLQFFEGSQRRLCALPFSIDDPFYSYAAEGISEGVMKCLGRVEEDKLRVIASPALQTAQRVRSNLYSLAEELNVDYFLCGGLSVRDGQFHLDAELIRAADTSSAWKGHLEGCLSNISALSAALAGKVANALSVYLPATTCCGSTSNKMSSLFLQARFLLEKRDGASIKKALDLFNKVTELDPGCAVAYSSIAKCYILLSLRFYLPNAQAKPAARSAALHALSLDDSIAGAHAALGWIDINFRHDWAVGLERLEHAVQLDPTSAFAQYALGRFLAGIGRFDDAILWLQRALEVDPLSTYIKAVLIWTLVCARRYDESVALADETLITHDLHGEAWSAAALAYAAAGRFEKAVLAAGRSIQLMSRDHLVRWIAADVYAQAGMADAAETLLRELRQNQEPLYFPSFLAASVWLHLGNKELALELLEQSYIEHCDWLSWLTVDPRFDPLRGDPRFEEIVRKLRFPEL